MTNQPPKQENDARASGKTNSDSDSPTTPRLGGWMDVTAACGFRGGFHPASVRQPVSAFGGNAHPRLVRRTRFAFFPSARRLPTRARTRDAIGWPPFGVYKGRDTALRLRRDGGAAEGSARRWNATLTIARARHRQGVERNHFPPPFLLLSMRAPPQSSDKIRNRDETPDCGLLRRAREESAMTAAQENPDRERSCQDSPLDALHRKVDTVIALLATGRPEGLPPPLPDDAKRLVEKVEALRQESEYLRAELDVSRRERAEMREELEASRKRCAEMAAEIKILWQVSR
ncbi:hypothetical protein FN846DRAFT_402961 [Sphaerosporella brunnea]|uniref:Uncharacterized protein n=1 Tax=Sphaerosporella brunnea TaxID=1250544 RepID=A0A5J5EI31_9PEZI|nr:hypothetical protein FN846DRAFT_402961 [Sphaerosporella brunnea]